MESTFRHEALLYAGDEEFVASTSAFVRDGLESGDPTLVVVAAEKIARLREELGADADSVQFADMASVGRNPARIIPAWQDFVARHAAPGTQVRGIGEPISAARTPDELVECHRHESLLNLAFGGSDGFWLLCPYDMEALEPEVIEEARRTHPLVAVGDGHESSGSYSGVEAIAAPFTLSLPDPPPTAAELHYEAEDRERLREFVAAQTTAALTRSRLIDLLLAAGEVAHQGIEASGRGGVARIWAEPGRIVCELRDGGPVGGPLADRELPTAYGASSALWLANQLCDLVQVRSLGPGRLVRLHLTRG